MKRKPISAYYEELFQGDLNTYFHKGGPYCEISVGLPYFVCSGNCSPLFRPVSLLARRRVGYLINPRTTRGEPHQPLWMAGCDSLSDCAHCFCGCRRPAACRNALLVGTDYCYLHSRRVTRAATLLVLEGTAFREHWNEIRQESAKREAKKGKKGRERKPVFLLI